MKKNKVTVIITTVLVIIALGLVFTNNKDTFTDKTKKFDIEDTAAVTKIFLSDKKNNNILLTRGEGDWLLNNKFTARKEAINLFLLTLKDIRVKFPVPKTAHNTIIKHLATAGVKVEIYQKVYRIDFFGLLRLFPHEKLTKVYYIGSATMDNQGNYMIADGAQTPYVVYIPGFRGFVSPRFSTQEDDWRDHAVFNYTISRIKSVQVEFPGVPQESYILENNGNKNSFMLSSLQGKLPVNNFDTLKVISFLTSFEKVNYEALLTNILSKGAKDTIYHTLPLAVISVTDISNKVNSIILVKKKAFAGQTDLNGNPVDFDRDRLYAIINGNKDIVLIQYFVFGSMLRPLSSFQKK